jgi:maleylpyruvate isomerase
MDGEHMNASSHLSDNLEVLTHETRLLIRTAATLDDETVRAPSRCEGWTRAHVLSHLARNADGLGNLVHWAVTGTAVAMYSSPQAREADIEAGSTRGAQEILTDLEDSAARFAAAAAALAGPPEQTEVEMRNERRVLGGQLPTLRLMEVVFHHVDLDAGYTFADADPGFVSRAVNNAVERMSAGGEAPSVVLHGGEGKTWTIRDAAGVDSAGMDSARDPAARGDDAAQHVAGSNAALLLWLARGDGADVTSDGPLPLLPAWG